MSNGKLLRLGICERVITCDHSFIYYSLYTCDHIALLSVWVVNKEDYYVIESWDCDIFIERTMGSLLGTPQNHHKYDCLMNTIVK